MATAEKAVDLAKVRERLRRLDALSRSPNRHEADTARRLAAKIRERYGLGPEPNPAPAGPDDVARVDWSPVLETVARDWSVILATAIAEACGCLLLTQTVSRKGKPLIVCRLVGTEVDRLAAWEAFDAVYPRMDVETKARRLTKVVFGGRLVDAWAAAEAVRAGAAMRGRMTEEERDRKLERAREAVEGRRVVEEE